MTQCTTEEPEPLPFTKLAQIFGAGELDMASPEDICMIDLELNSCRWVTSCNILPLSTAIKYSPSRSFRARMRWLVTTNDECIKAYGMLIYYALIKLRLWGMGDIVKGKFKSIDSWSEKVKMEHIKSWSRDHGLEMRKEEYILSPAIVSQSLQNDTLRRDTSTCILTGNSILDCFGVRATHIVPYKWGPRKSFRGADDDDLHAYRTVSVFLAAFLGDEIFNNIVEFLSNGDVENSITLNTTFHEAFNDGSFSFDPLLDTVLPDLTTGEIKSYVVCFRSHSAAFWNKHNPVSVLNGAEDRTEKSVKKVSPNMRLRFINHGFDDLPLPHPGLFVLHSCITRLIIMSGVGLYDSNCVCFTTRMQKSRDRNLGYHVDSLRRSVTSWQEDWVARGNLPKYRKATPLIASTQDPGGSSGKMEAQDQSRADNIGNASGPLDYLDPMPSDGLFADYVNVVTSTNHNDTKDDDLLHKKLKWMEKRSASKLRNWSNKLKRICHGKVDGEL
ncbi:hypothetical protein F5884DRAFT_751362 [Xylogone sp. PMI_703]|nr:hypothetical protein F5884DRAFT_751362 [Xylogone sp. PMI_703]